MITLSSVSRRFQDGLGTLTVLDEVSLHVDEQDYLSIRGRSGCGKSTLLNTIALLLRPSSGEVLFDGRETSGLSEEARVCLRGHNMGMVFQSPNLIDSLTPLDNITLAIRDRMSSRGRKKRALELLERVGLAEYSNRKIRSLSGGQAQRIAICRAVVGQPRLLLCDEPTGALDKEAADSVIRLLEEMRRQVGSALVLVTHDAELWARAARRYEMKDGGLVENYGQFGGPGGEQRHATV